MRDEGVRESDFVLVLVLVLVLEKWQRDGRSGMRSRRAF